jgi:hypothetical protein
VTAAPASKAKPKQAVAKARTKSDTPKPATKQTASPSTPGPAAPTQEASAAAPASGTNLLRGAQPTVPTGAFDNRFGAWR